MSTRSPRTDTIVAALVAIAYLVGLTYTHQIGGGPSAPSAKATSRPASPLADRVVSRSAHASQSAWLPSRPSPQVLSRNLRRAEFKWIFTRLKATDAELNWVTEGRFSELIRELRPAVERSDPRATAVFGWIAESCRLLRSAEQQRSWREFNSARLQQLSAPDQTDYRDVVARQDQWERSFRSACENNVDQDYADQRLERTAVNQDGASLWLLSRRSDNHAESLRLMSQAASTGFAQAQYEFARSLIMDPDARKAVPDAPTTAALLTEAAAEVPEAKVELAECLFTGCSGAQPDYAGAVEVARAAATDGEPDGILSLGSEASAGILGPDEVAAWQLFKSTLAAQGCYGDKDGAFGMEPRSAGAPTPPPSAAARTLAATFWQRYGAPARAQLGCD